MPKPGFTAITISNSLKQRLTRTARQLGLSVPRLIEEMLNANGLGTGMGTSTVTNFHNGGISINRADVNKILVARGRFELPSAGPKPAMLVRYTTGLLHSYITYVGENKLNMFKHLSLTCQPFIFFSPCGL